MLRVSVIVLVLAIVGFYVWKEQLAWLVELAGLHLILPEALLWFPSLSHSSTEIPPVKLFTKEELQAYKYKYLAIVGEVYDVSSGEKHYGEGGHYSFFTGLDGTRAFASGDFTEKGLIDDITGLKIPEIEAIESFRSRYTKDYVYVGKLIGNFYDEKGKETASKQSYWVMLGHAKENKLKEDEILKVFPPCNSEFNGQRSRVWCSNQSGGINRKWAGVPRKLFTPESDQFRCACIKTTGPPYTEPSSQSHSNRGDLDNPNLREYDGCDPRSKSCDL